MRSSLFVSARAPGSAIVFSRGRESADPGLATYAMARAICVEMECSALFIVGTLRRVRTGAIVAIDGDARSAASGDHDPHRDLVRKAVDREIQIALDAVVQLASGSCSTPRGTRAPRAGDDRAARKLAVRHRQRSQGWPGLL